MFHVIVGPLRVGDKMDVVHIAVPVRLVTVRKPVIFIFRRNLSLLRAHAHSRYHASFALGLRMACRPLVKLCKCGMLHICVYLYLE